MADRNFYLDNQRVAQIFETINKEKKIQRKYFEKEAAAGRLPEWVPPEPQPMQTLLQTVGVPAFTGRYSPAVDPELAMATSISKSMWTSNPGYVLRDGPAMTGTTHREFAYDTEAVAFMRTKGAFDGRFHKRQDEFSQYVEAAARAHHQLGSRPSAVTQGASKK